MRNSKNMNAFQENIRGKYDIMMRCLKLFEASSTVTSSALD